MNVLPKSSKLVAFKLLSIFFPISIVFAPPFLWSAAGSPPEPIQVFNQLQSSLSALLLNPSFTEETINHLKSARADVAAIEDHFIGNNIPMPQSYAEMLSVDANLLSQSSILSGSATRNQDNILDATTDLDLKASFIHSRKSLGLSASTSPFVIVKFSTEAGGKVVSGYLVRCNHRRFVNEITPSFVFNDPTSPASGEMPPGTYKCFLVLRNKTILTQDFSIGLSGKDIEDIKINVE